MTKKELEEYLKTRRMDWPYEGRYRIECKDNHRFLALIDNEIAGLSYAEVDSNREEACMKMNLKAQFAEYGIGTELLNLLMKDLIESGYRIIRYEIPKERYSFQIYKNLGLKVEKQDEERICFIREVGPC